jgi:hypothetical protein
MFLLRWFYIPCFLDVCGSCLHVLDIITLFHSPLWSPSLYICRIYNFVDGCVLSLVVVLLLLCCCCCCCSFIVAVPRPTLFTSWLYSLALVSRCFSCMLLYLLLRVSRVSYFIFVAAVVYCSLFVVSWFSCVVAVVVAVPPLLSFRSCRFLVRRNFKDPINDAYRGLTVVKRFVSIMTDDRSTAKRWPTGKQHYQAYNSLMHQDGRRVRPKPERHVCLYTRSEFKYVYDTGIYFVKMSNIFLSIHPFKIC